MIHLRSTARFSVWDTSRDDEKAAKPHFAHSLGGGRIEVELECAYTNERITRTFQKRAQRWTIDVPSSKKIEDGKVLVQWREMDAIDWEKVLEGSVIASSYFVRKGLSRKAQLWSTCRKFLSKSPGSALANALPETCVVETWEAFDEVWLYGFSCPYMFCLVGLWGSLVDLNDCCIRSFLFFPGHQTGLRGRGHCGVWRWERVESESAPYALPFRRR